MKARLLLGSDFPEEELKDLGGHAEVYRLTGMNEKELDAVLPSIDCVLVNFWPERLNTTRISKMVRLSLVQSALAGVNDIPFGDLPEGVVVCSNAGGYSDEVGEFAWGLLLSAAKRIVRLDGEMKAGGYERPPSAELGRGILVLRGRVLGILGYGGIGRTVAKFGKAFGMKVIVFSRSKVEEPGVLSAQGRDGLEMALRESDVVVLALPHTRSTQNIIGSAELSMMKRDAILVNVARAEVVDQDALYRHLVAHKGFVYATDVWWMMDGKEAYNPSLPFSKQGNFIGTPHASGPSAIAGRGPVRRAVSNLLRFLRGDELLNVVDRSEYG